MLVTIKLGGSIAFPEGPDLGLIEDFSKKVKKLVSGGCDVAVVVGAGSISRTYTKKLRPHMNEAFLDEIGIELARLNAKIIAKSLGGKYVTTLIDAMETVEEHLIPVMGGLTPGQSTDAVAAVVAEYLEADALLVLTNVDGIYDKDPKKYPDAKKMDRMDFGELRKICETLEYSASDYPVFDFVAAKTVSRSKIKTVVCNGSKVKDFRDAMAGKFGTVIDK